MLTNTDPSIYKFRSERTGFMHNMYGESETYSGEGAMGDKKIITESKNWIIRLDDFCYSFAHRPNA